MTVFRYEAGAGRISACMSLNLQAHHDQRAQGPRAGFYLWWSSLNVRSKLRSVSDIDF